MSYFQEHREQNITNGHVEDGRRENIRKTENRLNIFICLVLMLSFAFAICGCNKADKEEVITTEPSVITIKSDREDYVKEEQEVKEEIPEEEAVEEEFIYDDVNKIYSKETANPDEVVLRFVGDICFYDDFSLMGSYRNRGENIENCIDMELLDYMRGADIFMANNEFCYSDRGAPIEGKQYAFRSKPSNVKILDDMGVDIVSLANNHAYDWGPDALSDSVDVLNGARVPFVGAGKDIYEAMRPAYFKLNGITVSYVSATQIERFSNPDTKEATEDSPGVLRTLDPAKACQAISEAKANSDFCIMYVHWGSENTDLVEASQRDLAQKYVEAGADLIIGDHSHCLQGIDYIDDVPVFYSMSNYWFNSKTVDTGIAEIVLDTRSATGNKDGALSDAQNATDGSSDTTAEITFQVGEKESVPIKSVRFIPAIQQNCKTVTVDENNRERILNYLQGISNYAEIDIMSGTVSKSDTNHNIQGGMNTSPTKKVETEEEQQ